jgi:hypothetical protein
VDSPMSAALPLRRKLRMLTPPAAATHIVAAMLGNRRVAYFPWYDACLVRLLRCLPAWAFDAVMSHLAPRVLEGDY